MELEPRNIGILISPAWVSFTCVRKNVKPKYHIVHAKYQHKKETPVAVFPSLGTNVGS